MAAHSCNSTLKHMINKIRRDSQVFERSVAVMPFTYCFSAFAANYALYYKCYSYSQYCTLVGGVAQW